MSQTAYNSDMPEKFAGMKADISFDVVEGALIASEAIGFGLGVMANAAAPATKLDVADSAAGTFRGVSLATSKEQDANGLVQYAANEPVNVLRKGKVWVQTSGTVAVDAVAYVDIDQDGKFTSTSTDNLVTGGVFRTAVTGAGLALLEINLP